MEDIIFALFLILLFYGIPALTMASQSIKHYKKAKQKSDFVITDCAHCHSNNLSPIQDVSQNVKEYRSFIIKSFIAFIVFAILSICYFLSFNFIFLGINDTAPRLRRRVKCFCMLCAQETISFARFAELRERTRIFENNHV